MSTYLYNVCIDDLSAPLRYTGTGCQFHKSVNLLSYVDDTGLLAPTMDGLQNLICVCEVYDVKHGTDYNSSIRECMVVS